MNKILFLGNGGREATKVWKAMQSPNVNHVGCTPTNAGIGKMLARDSGSFSAEFAATDVQKIRTWALVQGVDMIVPGPEAAYFAGIVDAFKGSNTLVFGPNRRAAEFERSKAFAQLFMQAHGVACAKGEVFELDEVEEAKEYARKLNGLCVVKGSGPLLGKGVLMCSTVEEADEAIERFLVRHEFGVEGDVIVIQERLEGTEMSLHILVDGEGTMRFCPIPHDYKRLNKESEINTGGMGAYASGKLPDPAVEEEIREKILNPWLKGCLREGITYRGVLFVGIMWTKDGPKVLEINVRFGDPETQVLLPLLKSDFVSLLRAVCLDKLEEVPFEWYEDLHAVCVVAAARGYGLSEGPEKGKTVAGLFRTLPANSWNFHAGTKWESGNIVTNGGRVLGVTAVCPSAREARKVAYEVMKGIDFDGIQYRPDIGEEFV